MAEARSLAAQGIKEITLLGQIVDRYGLDLDENTSLADLFHQLHRIDALQRIRFLTSHPNWMTDELLETIADSPKVCESIEVPIQSGDDDILKAMKRGYTVSDYQRLIEKIRTTLPNAAIHTDIIVGFPGETDSQFQHTYDLLTDLRFDKVHIARYSPRPDTLAARKMTDNIPEKEKECRRRTLDELQAKISAEINQKLVGQTVQVLVETQQKGRWRGRTRTGKLVYFEQPDVLVGEMVNVEIEWAGPWSLVGVNRSTRATESGLSTVVTTHCVSGP